MEEEDLSDHEEPVRKAGGSATAHVSLDLSLPHSQHLKPRRIRRPTRIRRAHFIPWIQGQFDDV